MSPPRLMWILAALGLTVALTATPVLRQAASRAAWSLIGQPSQQAHALGIDTRSVIGIIRSIRTLRVDVVRLTDDNLRLQAELSRLKEVEHENSVLRQQLQFVQDFRDAFRMQPATVIGRDPATALQQVTVNRGRRDGIALGQAAVTNGFLVGRVSAITETTATLELITASRSRLPAVLTTSRVVGILTGGLAGLSLQELPADAVLPAGESVSTSGLGEIMPNGLPVGVIQERLSPASAFVQTYSVASPVDFTKLELVLLLSPTETAP